MRFESTSFVCSNIFGYCYLSTLYNVSQYIPYIPNTIEILLQSDCFQQEGDRDLKMLILYLAVAFLSQLSVSTNMEHIELPETEYPGEAKT